MVYLEGSSRADLIERMVPSLTLFDGTLVNPTDRRTTDEKYQSHYNIYYISYIIFHILLYVVVITIK